jgi:hypothetical protein
MDEQRHEVAGQHSLPETGCLPSALCLTLGKQPLCRVSKKQKHSAKKALENISINLCHQQCSG